ncbi:MAG: TerB family tellurite resistance protein [Rhodobacteraceae bacterium]|nr:TerB family tellurite resistance protein [Paracoccaceae bacterium]
MSLWSRIGAALGRLAAGEGLAAIFGRLRGRPERSVAFTIAVIALGAKMAKADGRVTRDEVAVFRALFTLPPGEEAHAARVFDLAREDIAGFEDYARRIAAMFRPDRERGRAMLVDLMEGLFEIAVADGTYHEAEDAFLARVAEIFGLDGRCLAGLRARHRPAGAEPDPWAVLGIARDAPLAEARAAYRAAVRATHPDRMVARGVPAEAVRLAELRLLALNRAWETIRGGAPG